MGAPGELYHAVNALRKAAEAELTGNGYYQAANRIAHLIEIIGPVEESPAPSKDRAAGFVTALAEVRNGLQSGLLGNRYYMAINKLEELAPFAAPAAPVPAQASPSFEQLAAVSKARVEAAAASLGVVMAHRALPLNVQPAETLADGELERRSSEPCLMAELAPPALEPVAPAPLPSKAAATAPHGGATQSLGSPPAQSEHGTVQGTAPPAAAAHSAAASALEPSAPAHDSEAAAAGQTLKAASDPAPSENPAEASFYLGSPAVSDASQEEEAVRQDIAAAGARNGPEPAARQDVQVKEPGEIKRKQPKTLFKLWLDLAFGRKD
jgi:hypothetical protein